MAGLRAASTAAAAVLSLLLAAPRAASAQGTGPAPADEAHAHFDRGLTLLHAENFEGALAEFQRSYELNARPSVLYNLAVTLQALHRYPEAARALEQYLRDAGGIPPERRAEIEQALAQIRALIARVTFALAVPGAAVRLDGVTVGISPLPGAVELGPGHHIVDVLVGGRPAGHVEFTIASGEERTVHVDVSAPAGAGESENPYGDSVPAVAPTTSVEVVGAPLDARVDLDGVVARAGEAMDVAPGVHAVAVTAPGRVAYRGTVDVRAGEHRRVTVRLADAATGPPPGVCYAGAVATATLGAAAAVFGALTMATRAQFDQLYQDDPSIQDVAARGNTYRDLTNGLLIATGVVGVATAVIFTRTRFSAPVSTADLSVAPLPGGGAASVRVRF